jgi:hypothetical protein
MIKRRKEYLARGARTAKPKKKPAVNVEKKK